MTFQSNTTAVDFTRLILFSFDNKMNDFFDKENYENWSLASYLAKTNARTNEDFNKAKANYIVEMLKMKNSKDYKDYKRRIGQLIKDAKVMSFIDFFFFDMRYIDIFIFRN